MNCANSTSVNTWIVASLRVLFLDEHTAMSALSAIVSSCSGDGDLFGRGGEGGEGGGAAFFFFLSVFVPFALRKMGAIFSSSVGGADDRLDESESSMVARYMLVGGFLVEGWLES